MAIKLLWQDQIAKSRKFYKMAVNPLNDLTKFDNSLREEFSKYGEIINFTKKDNPFDADSTIEYFYIIISGKVKVYDMNFDTNREQTLYLLVKGDMYDVVSLLDGKFHELAVEVLEKGSAIKFSIKKVREWMREYPHFEQLIFNQIGYQVRSLESLSLDLSLLETKDRLLKLLMRNVDVFDKKGVEILKNMSHTEIANLIGTVRHVIERHLKEFTQEGVIEDKKHLTSIKNAKNFLKILDRF